MGHLYVVWKICTSFSEETGALLSRYYTYSNDEGKRFLSTHILDCAMSHPLQHQSPPYKPHICGYDTHLQWRTHVELLCMVAEDGPSGMEFDKADHFLVADLDHFL